MITWMSCMKSKNLQSCKQKIFCWILLRNVQKLVLLTHLRREYMMCLRTFSEYFTFKSNSRPYKILFRRLIWILTNLILNAAQMMLNILCLKSLMLKISKCFTRLKHLILISTASNKLQSKRAKRFLSNGKYLFEY